MSIGAAFIIMSTLISTFNPGAIGGFIASRALTGIGQGLVMPAGLVYINEIAPASLRGTIMSFWQLFFGFGFFFGVLGQLRLHPERRVSPELGMANRHAGPAHWSHSHHRRVVPRNTSLVRYPHVCRNCGLVGGLVLLTGTFKRISMRKLSHLSVQRP